jgi:hypothetical protein
VSRRLTRLDEWPRHQTLETFDTIVSDSPRWSDGYWFCVGDPEGRCLLLTALRWYPNTNVVDGYAICSLDDGRQHNLRVSRRMRPRIDDLDCGPLWMEIIEGLRTMRFGAGPNDAGLEFDLRWDGAAPCFDETAGMKMYVDGRVSFGRSNFVQVGHVSGSISVAGRHFEVGADWAGARDHSWGIGETGTGNMPDVAAPSARGHIQGATLGGFGLRQWALVRFPERSIYYWFHHGADGHMSVFASRVDYPFESGREGWSYRRATVEHTEFVDGARRLDRAVVAFTRYDDKVERFAVRTVSRPVYMQGGGYWDGYDDGRGRGVYRGESIVEADVWDVSHPTVVRGADGEVLAQRNGAWAETFAVFENLDDPSERGLGLLEAVVGGPYPGITED